MKMFNYTREAIDFATFKSDILFDDLFDFVISNSTSLNVKFLKKYRYAKVFNHNDEYKVKYMFVNVFQTKNIDFVTNGVIAKDTMDYSSINCIVINKDWASIKNLISEFKLKAFS